MTSQIPKENILHVMLLKFRNGSNETVATKTIRDVYLSTLKIRECQKTFFKFRSSNFDLSFGKTNNIMLRAEVEANLCQAIEDLSNTLHRPWSAIQGYF